MSPMDGPRVDRYADPSCETLPTNPPWRPLRPLPGSKGGSFSRDLPERRRGGSPHVFAAARQDGSTRESTSMSGRLVESLRGRWTQWGVARRPPGGMVRRRTRLRVEGLEERALLTTLTEYPITSKSLVFLNQIVTGPDGNLWFTENDAVSNT